jgi:hypothetical protein
MRVREIVALRTPPESTWQVIPRILRHRNGDATVRLDFEMDYDQPRPHWWHRLPTVLLNAGYEIDPVFDGSEESFSPGSFFSASALIVARKIYAHGRIQILRIRDDVARLSAFLGQHRAGRTNRIVKEVLRGNAVLKAGRL